MAKTIKLKKQHTLNGKQYGKGEVLSVSLSIYNVLKTEGIADEYEAKKETPKKKVSKAKKDG